MIVELCRLNRSFLAKIVFYPKNFYPLLLPSHNCIIITMFSFQGAAWILKIQWNLLFPRNFSQSLTSVTKFKKWWAKMDSNHRPHDYQSCALASWAIGPYWTSHFFCRYMVEISGIEPLTSCLQGRRSPSWAKPPYPFSIFVSTSFVYPLNWIMWNLTLCTDLRTLQEEYSFFLKSP